MKKILLLFFLIIMISCYNKEKTETVFNENVIDNNYNITYLDVSNMNITTKNYDEIKDLNIIGVFYKINDLHQNLFKSNYYPFRDNNIENNLNDLNDYYMNILKKNNLITEQYKINIQGIKITKIKVYISNKDKTTLIKKYKLKQQNM